MRPQKGFLYLLVISYDTLRQRIAESKVYEMYFSILFPMRKVVFPKADWNVGIKEWSHGYIVIGGVDLFLGDAGLARGLTVFLTRWGARGACLITWFDLGLTLFFDSVGRTRSVLDYLV